MSLFKLLNLVKTGRDIKRDPLAAGLDMAHEVISPILLIPVLILGGVSILFGVLSIIFPYKILSFVFWLSVPFTLMGCMAHVLVTRVIAGIGRRASQSIHRFAQNHGIHIPTGDSSLPHQNSRIIDVDYTE